jgi:hypothetical protein
MLSTGKSCASWGHSTTYVYLYRVFVLPRPLRLTEMTQHQNAFPGEELLQMRRVVSDMLERLDDARHASRDQPDGPSFEVVTKKLAGTRGRPRKEINPEWLARMSSMRDKTGISSLINLSTRTIRRRQLELRLYNPGVAPAQRLLQADGTYDVVYNGQPGTRRNNFTEDEVDALVTSHLDIFPNFGRSMIIGSLLSSGQHLTREQLRASYNRLQGGPTQTFSDRRIHRRSYHVAGPNSLWHHDGQHGMCVMACRLLVPQLTSLQV